MNRKFFAALISAVLAAAISAAPAMAVSLWRDGADLFTDRKASGLGDIVLVDIDENIDDSDEGKISSSKTTNDNIGSGFGLLDFIRSFGLGTTSAMNGNTKVERTKELTGTISCLVTDVLPNGNLVIEGDRILISGAEKMKVRFSGVVRRMDISHSNRVPSSRVANAEVAVSGKGVVTRTQRPGVINQILSAIF